MITPAPNKRHDSGNGEVHNLKCKVYHVKELPGVGHITIIVEPKKSLHLQALGIQSWHIGAWPVAWSRAMQLA